jgi:defect-in-organelle-trafficking protein DotB
MDNLIQPESFDIPIPVRIIAGETLKELLLHMEEIGGSDLFILGGGEVWTKRFSKMVKLTKRKLSDKEAFGIITEIYGTNAEAKLGSGTKIDTSLEFMSLDSEGKQNRHRFRVNAISCLRNGRKSITITLRSIPSVPRSIHSQNVDAELIEACQLADSGLIVVAGATGNGKTTLLAGLIRDQVEAAAGNRVVVTIESPIEFVYDDIDKPSSIITQLEVGQHVGSFDEGVINSLRMAPSTILIGETRDQETAEAAVESSTTGHVVFTTVHANTAAETIYRLLSLFPEELQHQAKQNIIQSLKVIVAQRLIPTIDGKRTAIREYIVFNQEIKEALLSANNLGACAFQMVEKHGKPMIKDIIDKFEAGIISEEEFKRQKMNYDKGDSDAS